MDSYRFQSLDITQYIELHSGKSLEDLFQNQNVVTNDMGEFLELTWEIEKDDCPCDINLQITKKICFLILRLFTILERMLKIF